MFCFAVIISFQGKISVLNEYATIGSIKIGLNNYSHKTIVCQIKLEDIFKNYKHYNDLQSTG